jgi:hypothetical protein
MIGHISGPPARTISHIQVTPRPVIRSHNERGIIPETRIRSRRRARLSGPGDANKTVAIRGLAQIPAKWFW